LLLLRVLHHSAPGFFLDCGKLSFHSFSRVKMKLDIIKIILSDLHNPWFVHVPGTFKPVNNDHIWGLKIWSLVGDGRYSEGGSFLLTQKYFKALINLKL
jgi:hypothetical protein